jgi:hypothetical protein
MLRLTLRERRLLEAQKVDYQLLPTARGRRYPLTVRVFGVGPGLVNKHPIASRWLWMALAAQPRQTYRKHRFIFVRLGRNIPVVGNGDLASNIEPKAHAAIATRN